MSLSVGSLLLHYLSLAGRESLEREICTSLSVDTLFKVFCWCVLDSLLSLDFQLPVKEIPVLVPYATLLIPVLASEFGSNLPTIS